MNSTPFESIVDCLPTGLCIVDGEGRILSINPALEQLLGWRSAELRGQSLSSCLEQTISDPAQALCWTVALSQALALTQTIPLNLPADFRAGPDDISLVSVLGIVAPWQDSDTQQSGAMIIFHDSSLYKDIEGARARLLAVLAHELGTPVANLTAAADLLAEHLAANKPDPWRLLQVIQAEVSRIGRQLAQFRSISSALAGDAHPRKRLVTLGPVLRQVAQAFQVRDLDCQIAVQVPPELPFVWSSVDRIQDILNKLVDNAIRYAPPGTQVILAAEQRGDEIVVSVSDRGLGVSEQDEKLIFEPWCRGSQEEPSAEHQGLGLSMARTMVQSLGGRLWHERCPEGGARFCFTVPRAQNVPDGG
jgi:signal transduction histidine kinase